MLADRSAQGAAANPGSQACSATSVLYFLARGTKVSIGPQRVLELYTAPVKANSLHITEQLATKPIASMTLEQRVILDGPLTGKEAIDAVARGKTPGLDGLPEEFDAAFKDKLIPSVI
ncbi:hypothetical protein NDU88_003191 [Pleurodeles waltl]|uniref:Uncharacterized protein n=1 Tax=Pleurodeles waltl TaxID=8319 RepID=A0AAV7TMS8_PLEWA|nr:hypothetical protein NDU88_003191 [Pleurodeles waltl]